MTVFGRSHPCSGLGPRATYRAQLDYGIPLDGTEYVVLRLHSDTPEREEQRHGASVSTIGEFPPIPMSTLYADQPIH